MTKKLGLKMVTEAITEIGNFGLFLARIESVDLRVCQICKMIAERRRHLIEDCPARSRHWLENFSLLKIMQGNIVEEGRTDSSQRMR